jgi:hypothetical protein
VIDRAFIRTTATAAFACAALSLAGPLGGCESIKRGLGMEKVVPDEFAVTASAPLAIPPDYTLRPPRPGAAPSQTPAPIDQARQTVFRASDAQLGSLPPADADRSEGEGELLKQAGADAAPKDIRQLLTDEASAVPDKSGFIDTLLFWRPTAPALAPADETIDPSSEAERLRTAAASQAGNAPAGAGASPGQTAAAYTGKPVVIERTKPKGFFDWLF